MNKYNRLLKFFIKGKFIPIQVILLRDKMKYLMKYLKQYSTFLIKKFETHQKTNIE